MMPAPSRERDSPVRRCRDERQPGDERRLPPREPAEYPARHGERRKDREERPQRLDVAGDHVRLQFHGLLDEIDHVAAGHQRQFRPRGGLDDEHDQKEIGHGEGGALQRIGAAFFLGFEEIEVGHEGHRHHGGVLAGQANGRDGGQEPEAALAEKEIIGRHHEGTHEEQELSELVHDAQQSRPDEDGQRENGLGAVILGRQALEDQISEPAPRSKVPDENDRVKARQSGSQRPKIGEGVGDEVDVDDVSVDVGVGVVDEAHGRPPDRRRVERALEGAAVQEVVELLHRPVDAEGRPFGEGRVQVQEEGDVEENGL
ncbi:MAG: hypothetical protein Q8R59_03785, partial [Polaromonas sp.]|nr:hypothetical protein [Polaromonas sp.]